MMTFFDIFDTISVRYLLGSDDMVLFLSNICEVPDILKVILFIKELLKIICFLVPILLIVVITIDFAKCVISSSEDSMKKIAMLSFKKIIMAMGLFLVPAIVKVTMTLLGNLNLEYIDCLKNADLSTISNLEANITQNTTNSNNSGSTSSNNNNNSNSNNNNNSNNTNSGNKTIAVSSIKLNSSSKTIKVGEKYVLTATVKPSNATNKKISWTSSNKKVATVTNGEIKGIAPGNATITAKSSNGKTISCKITVKKNSTNTTVSSISLNEKNKMIYLNSSKSKFTLTATIKPSNATNKNVSWTSSNKKVATVSNNGVVTPLAVGSTTITAKVGNKSSTMTLNVKKKVIIEVGASQSQRFINYKKFNYTKGDNQYTYNSKDRLKGTLVHIAKSGAGMSWQYSPSEQGYIDTLSVMDSYSNEKQNVEFYLYYLLIGNTIKNFSCNTIDTDSNPYIKALDGYSNATNTFKSRGYNVTTYIVSVQPVKPGTNGSSSVVSNSSSNYCNSGYRSNWKYNMFNNKVKQAIASKYSNLHYVDAFNSIIDSSQATSSNRKYTYKVEYKCTDGIHWDNATTGMYLNLMLNNSNANL